MLPGHRHLGRGYGRRLENIGRRQYINAMLAGDDVRGFDQVGPLDGGIQATGGYPGRARNHAELMADMDLALGLVPGSHKINLHACYGIYDSGDRPDRNALEPKHFAPWVAFARKRGLGIDFNPTFFPTPRPVP